MPLPATASRRRDLKSLTVVIGNVNYIRSHALNQRQFKELLQDARR